MWFRFYTEALDDPKVQRLPADQFRVWVNLLCIAKRFDGKLPSGTDCAFMLRMELAAFHETFEALKSSGLFDEKVGQDQHTEPHNWSKRQYKSDSSTERVKRYRKRFHSVKVTPPETETEAEAEQRKIDTKNFLKEFEAWWRLWTITGTKKGKAASQRKYDIARRETSHEDLCDGLTRYMRHCTDSGTVVSMIAHPKTWLHQGYWSNEYELDAVDEPPTHGGAMFEPDPVDYGFPSDSILVASAPMYWSFRLPDGTTKEVRR